MCGGITCTLIVYSYHSASLTSCVGITVLSYGERREERHQERYSDRPGALDAGESDEAYKRTSDRRHRECFTLDYQI